MIKKIIFIIFLSNIILLPDTFCMSCEQYSEEDRNIIKSFIFLEREKISAIKYIESKIFPILGLLEEYLSSEHYFSFKEYLLSTDEEVKVNCLVSLKKRKKNLFKKSWKKLIINMSYEEFHELKNEIEYLKSIMFTIYFKGFLHLLGFRVSFLRSDILIFY